MNEKRKAGPRKGPSAVNSRGRMTVPVDTRGEAEMLARWVEDKFHNYAELIAREARWVREHPEDRDAPARLAAYRYALATAQQIAYYLRTHKVRGTVE